MARPPPPRRNPPPPRQGGAAAGVARAPAAPAPAGSFPGDDGSELPQTFFLGRYRVVDEIGVGGMASVHLARVDGPGGFQKWVAIKRIHPHLVEDDQFVDMFLDEARIAAGINHAHVAQVFDLGKDDNTYWIAMEYLHGEPLREIMRSIDDRRVRIPYHIAAKICSDSAEGLHAAHELRGRNGQLLNLVHRDVTPHNLFVTYDGYTKVVDFGIAKVVDRLASTRAGTLKGKLAYMSPEQVRGQDVDRRTDIFALGVVLWELTTNQRLFRRETDLDTLEQVQACVVPLPSTIVPDYPPELEQVVMRALARKAEDRFQTTREFSRALQGFLMKLGTFVGPEDVGDYIKKLFDERVKKRERYLEWAAEVTSAVDLDELHQQQDGGVPNLMHTTPDGRRQRESSSSNSHVQQRSDNRSYSQSSMSAAVVTSAPGAAPELAAHSLLDDDEDIPTIVASRDATSQALILAAAAAQQAQRQQQQQQQQWDGGATQLVEDSYPGVGPSGVGGLDSTIALPDGSAAMQIQAEISRREQNYQQQPSSDPLAPQHYPPYDQQQLSPAARQAAIETKMSMPRPAAVTQWLAEQGNIEIGAPRSTAVLISIAALATLCVMGVVSLIVFKLRTPAHITPGGIPTAAEVQPSATGTAKPKDPKKDDADGDKGGDKTGAIHWTEGGRQMVVLFPRSV